MRTPFAPLAVLLLAAPARPADPPPEQKVLDRFVGTWATTFTAPKAEWNPEARTGTARVTTERVLGGAFVQEKHANGDGTSGLVLRTYDTERKAYRQWLFFSTGQTHESTGTWDAKASTFTWTESAPGHVSTLVQKFADADTVVWDLVVKGTDGKLLLKMEGKTTRVKDGKK